MKEKAVKAGKIIGIIIIVLIFAFIIYTSVTAFIAPSVDINEYIGKQFSTLDSDYLIKVISDKVITLSDGDTVVILNIATAEKDIFLIDIGGIDTEKELKAIKFIDTNIIYFEPIKDYMYLLN